MDAVHFSALFFYVSSDSRERKHKDLYFFKVHFYIKNIAYTVRTVPNGGLQTSFSGF